MTTVTLPSVRDRNPWDEFLRRRKPVAFNYLFLHLVDLPAPDLDAGLRSDTKAVFCRSQASSIDGLRLSAAVNVIAAETVRRVPAWEALPECLLLSVHRENGHEPEVLFFRLDEWVAAQNRAYLQFHGVSTLATHSAQLEARPKARGRRT